MNKKDTPLPVFEQLSGRRIIHHQDLYNLTLKDAGLS